MEIYITGKKDIKTLLQHKKVLYVNKTYNNT